MILLFIIGIALDAESYLAAYGNARDTFSMPTSGEGRALCTEYSIYDREDLHSVPMMLFSPAIALVVFWIVCTHQQSIAQSNRVSTIIQGSEVQGFSSPYSL